MSFNLFYSFWSFSYFLCTIGNNTVENVDSGQQVDFGGKEFVTSTKESF